jgi:hypothetical protein
MSPEQARGQPVDKRTDIWAFGCVLYEMLAGRTAFTGATVSDTVVAILEREPDWAALPDSTPTAVRRLLRRCLAKDARLRLRDIGDARLEVDDALHAKPSSRAPLPRARSKVGTAAAIVSVAALGAWAFSPLARPRQSDRIGSVLRLQLTPPVGVQLARLGFERSSPNLSLSPDGTAAVYSAMVDGRYALWLHPLDGTAPPRVLPGSEDAMRPFWSPDGRSIGFFTRGKLWRIDRAGGSAFAICDVPPTFGGAWSPDGRILVGIYAGTIASVPASGGTLTPLTALDPTTEDRGHVWPQVLPNGHFLYWAASSKSEHDGVVYAASFEKPSQRVRLVATSTHALYTSGPDGTGYLLWQRDGTLVAQAFDGTTLAFAGEPRPIADGVGVVAATADMTVSVSTKGTLLYASQNLERLTWFDRSGKQRGTVGDPALYAPRSYRISPDGNQIAATRAESGRDLWLIDVNRGTSRRVTYGSGGGYYPQWSPDSRTLLFLGDACQLSCERTSRASCRTNASPHRLHTTSWTGRAMAATSWRRGCLETRTRISGSRP